jgi:ferredoxin-like protein FixX
VVCHVSCFRIYYMPTRRTGSARQLRSNPPFKQSGSIHNGDTVESHAFERNRKHNQKQVDARTQASRKHTHAQKKLVRRCPATCFRKGLRNATAAERARFCFFSDCSQTAAGQVLFDKKPHKSVIPPTRILHIGRM